VAGHYSAFLGTGQRLPDKPELAPVVGDQRSGRVLGGKGRGTAAKHRFICDTASGTAFPTASRTGAGSVSPDPSGTRTRTARRAAAPGTTAAATASGTTAAATSGTTAAATASTTTAMRERRNRKRWNGSCDQEANRPSSEKERSA